MTGSPDPAPTNSQDETTAWLNLARRAVADHIGLSDARISWMGHTHNATFLVETNTTKVVLSLFKHGADFDRLVSQWEYLRALKLSTSLRVSTYIKFLSVYDEPQHREIQGILRDYLPGEPLPPESINTVNMKTIADFLATLHDFSERYIPPPNFNLPRLDWNGLFGENGVYPLHNIQAVFSQDQQAIMAAGARVVAAAMQSLGDDSQHFGLIHGDLLSKNILFHEGQVAALDFEYAGWGYYLYDLAPLLWQLKTRDDYQQLADALWLHYTALRPHAQPFAHLLETFIAARQIASMRWLAGNLDHPAIREHAPGLIQQRTKELYDFLKTGTLTRESRTL